MITGPVEKGDIVAHYAAGALNAKGVLVRPDGTLAGKTSGPHMHIQYRKNGKYVDLVEAFGGQAALGEEGFGFDENDPASCTEEGGE